MNIVINHLDEFEKELQITLDWYEIEEDYNDLLKRYAKIPIKGFRTGKVPASITESTFKNEIKNDLVAACSTRFCRRAMKEHHLEAGSSIGVNDAELQRNQSLSFKAHFIEMPKFELPDYINLEIQSIDDEDILNEISEKLLEKTEISIHPSLIEEELIYSDTEENSPEEENESALDRVKLMLILKKIASQDNIEINNKDVDDRIKLIAEENNMQAKEVKDYLITNGGLGRLSDSLLAEHVLAYIKEANVNNMPS